MATKWLKVAKSGTSPLQRFWKNSEFFKDTLKTKITLRNLLKEIVCENQNFRSDLTVLYVEFHGDSDGNGFKVQKPIIDPLIGPN